MNKLLTHPYFVKIRLIKQKKRQGHPCRLLIVYQCYMSSAAFANLYPIPQTFFMYSAFETVSFFLSDLM